MPLPPSPPSLLLVTLRLLYPELERSCVFLLQRDVTPLFSVFVF